MTVDQFSPCDALKTLTDFQAKVIAQVYSKFKSLQRLAAILEKAGDITGLLGAVINSIPSLVPVQLLRDFEAYNKLRDACPMLGLPAAGLESTAALQTKVASAYADLVRRLDLHQYNRLDKLQGRIDDLVAKARGAIGTDWMVCASAICKATEDLHVTKLKEDFKAEVNRVANLPATATQDAKTMFRIVDDGAIKKINDLKVARAQLIFLGKSENAEVQATFNRLSR